MLKAFDSKVTVIDHNSTAPIQVASGNPVTDADGTRQATLMFTQGTDATMHLPDGSTQPLGDLQVRATEFTVGPNGQDAMPGELPPSGAYTYPRSSASTRPCRRCDRRHSPSPSRRTSTTSCTSRRALVPAAFYDEAKGAWVPSANGSS